MRTLFCILVLLLNIGTSTEAIPSDPDAPLCPAMTTDGLPFHHVVTRADGAFRCVYGLPPAEVCPLNATDGSALVEARVRDNGRVACTYLYGWDL